MRVNASKQGLERIKQTRKGWSDDRWCREASKLIEPNINWEDQEHIADGRFATGCSLPTLKHFLAGKRIDVSIFQAFCQVLGLNWEEVVDPDSNSQLQERTNKANFIDNFWVGRKSLIERLSVKLRGNCHVLVLAGITGIGKTALAYQLAKTLQTDGFNFEKPLDLYYDDRKPDFTSVAADLLIRWQERVTADDRKEPELLLNRLLHKLINNSYLVQIDSLEMLLDGDVQIGWNNFLDQWWVIFFQRLLAAQDCQSRLILTSQHFPTQFQELGYAEVWHCEPLTGLDKSERLLLFRKTGIEVDSDSATRLYLERIGSAYEGHPLALLVISGEIMSEPFYGDFLAYWQEHGREIEEIEKAAQREEIQSGNDRFRLDRYSFNLRGLVKKRVELTFKRLYEDFNNAYVLLCHGSIYRRQVSEKAWFGSLKKLGYDEELLLDAMDALSDRYLVEKVEDEFTEGKEAVRQHNLIRSVALEHLKKLKTKRQLA